MTLNNKVGLVFLAGGGMSSWVWADIIDSVSIPSIAPKYRLHENTEKTRKTSTISDCTDYIIELIKKNKLSKVILVAHSGAGIIAANIAKKFPHSILHVIYIAANLPENGKSTVDSLPLPIKLLNKIAIYSQIKKDSTPANKSEKIIRKMFCNTCPEERIRYILRQTLLSEPLCLAFEKNNWEDFPYINQTYIILTKDKTISVKNQKKMMGHLSIQNSIEIESDHMVMLSHAQELSETLNSIISLSQTVS